MPEPFFKKERLATHGLGFSRFTILLGSRRENTHVAKSFTPQKRGIGLMHQDVPVNNPQSILICLAARSDRWDIAQPQKAQYYGDREAAFFRKPEGKTPLWVRAEF